MAGDIKDIYCHLGRFDSQIKLEFDLIGFRMTWLVVSQSFLFNVIAFVYKGGTEDVNPVLFCLRYVAPIMGLIISLCAFVSIDAAHSKIEELKQERRDFEVQHSNAGFARTSVDLASSVHKRGNWPSRVIPLAFLLSWLVLIGVILKVSFF